MMYQDNGCRWMSYHLTLASKIFTGDNNPEGNFLLIVI
ncbi:hypothetical protein HMPREF9690_00215 [Raoultella ornithinolytica 10-5246]|jgi:hypothetical protein|nr:hypothetical protein HMPREF9690_00215 [Raoultella ornithinolytica 10-5246]